MANKFESVKKLRLVFFKFTKQVYSKIVLSSFAPNFILSLTVFKKKTCIRKSRKAFLEDISLVAS